MDTDAARDGGARDPRPLARAAGVALVLLVLLVLVAVASGARGRGRLDAAPRGIPPGTFDYLFTLGVVFVVTLVVVALVFFRKPWVAPAKDPTGFFRLAAFMLFLAAFGYLAMRTGLGGGFQEGLEGLLERREAVAAATAPEQDRRAVEPLRFRWEVVGVALGSAAAAALIVLRRRLRRGAEPAPVPLAERVAAVLDETLDDLRAERDARRAVIAAYARMEATLAAHGLPRRPSEAPLEFLARALDRLRVPVAAALDLTSLFECAKFSLHPIDADMKDEAIAALLAVRDRLRAPA